MNSFRSGKLSWRTVLDLTGLCPHGESLPDCDDPECLAELVLES